LKTKQGGRQVAKQKPKKTRQKNTKTRKKKSKVFEKKNTWKLEDLQS